MRTALRYIVLFMALCFCGMAYGQKAYYWFDSQAPSEWTPTNTLNGRITVDVSKLLDGVHTLHYQVAGTDSKTTPTVSALFVKPRVADGSGAAADRYVCWFDGDYAGRLTGSAANGVMTLNVSKLLDGVHTVHYQVIDAHGQTTPTVSALFVKPRVADGSSAAADRYVCWFDSDYEHRLTGKAANGMMTLDVASLLDGVHTVHYQVIDANGQTTPAQSALFVKPRTASGGSAADRYVCWFDSDYEHRLTGKATNGVMTLDVAGLLDGVHTVHYQVIDANGQTTPAQSALFVKPRTASGSSVADSYVCWFDDDYQHAVTGKLSDGGIVMDTEELKVGVHMVHLFVKGDKPSNTVSAAYVKYPTPLTDETENLLCVSYIDGDSVESQTLPPTGGIVNWKHDLLSLKAGMHSDRVVVYDHHHVARSERTGLFLHFPNFSVKQRGTYKIDMSLATDGTTYTYKSADTSVATVSKDGLVTGVKVGTTTLTVTGSDSQSYTCTVTVEEMDPITVTVKDTVRVYGDENPAFEFEMTGGTTEGKPQITCEASKNSAVGTYEIKIAAGTLDYPNLILVGGTLTVSKAPLKVKADDKTMKQASAVPQLTVTYNGFKNGETEAVLTTKPTVTTTATSESEQGEYPITVSGGEAKNYMLSYEDGTLTVKEADPITITVTDTQRNYGDENPTFEYTVTGGTIEGTPKLTCEASKWATVGTYEIKIAAGSIKYPNLTLVGGTLTLTKAPLTVTADNKVMKQGDPVPELTITYSGFKNNETENVLTEKPTVSTTATSLSPEGSYPITVEGGDAQNYELNRVNGTVTVTQADPITIAVVNAEREYGEDNPAFEYTVTGGTIAETPIITCEAGKDTPVGTYDIKVAAGQIDYPNLILVGGTLTVTKAPLLVKADDQTMKQAGSMPELTVSYSGFKNGETEAVLTRKPTASTTATPESALGEYPITVYGGDARNYTLSYENGIMTVTEAPLVTVTVTDTQREYGDENPTFEYTVSGGTIQGTPQIVCEAGKDASVGTYDIRIEAGSIRYPNLVLVGGTLTVTKAPLTVKADNKVMKEGDAVPALTVTYSGFKNGETEDVLTVKPTASTTATAESERGEYPITVSGGEAQNYELTYLEGTLTVTKPDQIVLMVSDAEREYGEDNPTFEYTVTGGTVDWTPEITCEAGKDSPVGTYEIRIVADDVNYPNLVLVGGTLTVTKAPLTVTADDQTMTEGDDVPTLTVSYSGFKNGETEDVLTVKPTANTTATPQSLSGAYPITVSGGEARNYSMTYSSGTLRVEPRPEQLVLTVNMTSGEVAQGTEIMLSAKNSQGDDVEDAAIYYTLDGTEPTDASTLYEDAIILEESCTLKAVAMKTGYAPSEVLMETYTVIEDDTNGQWEDPETGIVYAYNTAESVAKVQRVRNTAQGNVAIRNTIIVDGKEYTVTEVAKRAFAGASSVTSVTVPTSVTNFYESAFANDGLLALVWQSSSVVPANVLPDQGGRSQNFLLYVSSASQAPSDVTNVVVKTGDGYQMQGTLTLQENEGFHCPVAFKAEAVSYTHAYQMTTGFGNSEGWETLALPFDVETIRHADGRVLVPFASYRADSDNRPFWLYAMSESGFVKTGSIKANTPYIICMPNNEAYLPEYNITGEVTFMAHNVMVQPSTDVQTVTAGNRTFVPTFRKIRSSSSVATLNSVNRLHSNTGGEAPGSRFISNLRLASPFEAVFEGSASSVRSFAIDFVPGVTNGIDEVPATRPGQQKIYNLKGQRVSKMQRGHLYIVDGRKRMAK